VGYGDVMRGARKVAVAAGAILTLFAVWWVLLTIDVASETGGPCPTNGAVGMTKLGWSWSSFGYVCEARLSDGTRYRYVTRGGGPPDAVLNDGPEGP